MKADAYYAMSRGQRRRVRRAFRKRIAEGVCHYCGLEPANITKDHIVPKSRGGIDAPWNVVPSCFSCNQEKGNKWPTCECYTCRESIRKHWRLHDITENS